METVKDFKAEEFLLNKYNLVNYTDFELNIFQNLDTISLEDNNSFNITLQKEKKKEFNIDNLLDHLDSLHSLYKEKYKEKVKRNKEFKNSLIWDFNTSFEESSKTLQSHMQTIADYQNTIIKDYVGENTIFSNAALSALSFASNTISQFEEGIQSVLNDEYVFNKYKALKNSILSYDYITSVKDGTTRESINLNGLYFKKAYNPTITGGTGPTIYMLKPPSKEKKDDESQFVLEPFKSKTYQKQLSEESTSLIHNIITSTDFQMQYYIAYFTKIVNNEESLVKLYIKTLKNDSVIDDVTKSKNTDSIIDNRYYYFFYTDAFNFTPVKKTTANLKYGAFTTTTALNKPEGKNTFSFSIASDLELTFWEFITKNGLGLNSTKAYYSNDSKKSIKDKLNLNILMYTSYTASDSKDIDFVKEEDIDKVKMNKFVLEDIEFSELKNLNFSQQFKQMKLNVSGTYRKLKWYHNIPFSKI